MEIRRIEFEIVKELQLHIPEEPEELVGRKKDFSGKISFLEEKNLPVAQMTTFHSSATIVLVHVE